MMPKKLQGNIDPDNMYFFKLEAFYLAGYHYLYIYSGSDYDLLQSPRLMQLWGPPQTEQPSNSPAPVLNILNFF
jgi:hypothetical protein